MGRSDFGKFFKDISFQGEVFGNSLIELRVELRKREREAEGVGLSSLIKILKFAEQKISRWSWTKKYQLKRGNFT